MKNSWVGKYITFIEIYGTIFPIDSYDVILGEYILKFDIAKVFNEFFITFISKKKNRN